MSIFSDIAQNIQDNLDPNTQNLEYVRLKVFLYKYTPDFVPDGKVTQGFFNISRFKIDLDDAKYYSKYDITDFVMNYNFQQNLYENTYSWSINFYDKIITKGDLTKLRLPISTLPSPIDGKTTYSTTNTGLTLLSKFEAENAEELNANDPVEVETIAQAKINRGYQEKPFTPKAGLSMNTVADKSSLLDAGIRLSDLIQPYDIISVFIYKRNYPWTEVSNDGKIETPFPIRYNLSRGGSTTYLKEEDLQDENILMSVLENTPLFANEFNGFVLKKDISRRTGAVDTVAVTGNGITRLFGATRRVVKSSLLEDSVYDQEERNNLVAITALQTVFADQPILKIFIDLFSFVYHITIHYTEDQVDASPTLTIGSTSATQETFPKTIITPIPNENFYDRTVLVLGNELQNNSFTIPPFLLATVMKNRGFNTRSVKPGSTSSLLTGVQSLNTIGPFTQEQQLANEINNVAQVDNFLSTQASSEQDILINTNADGLAPVFFDPALSNLRAYFLFLADVFKFFNPEWKTPFEIIDDLKKSTFLEFFETPSGQIIIRNPQYNSQKYSTDSTQSDIILSSDLSNSDITYSETVENLVSKQKVAYGCDVLSTILPDLAYAYTNGKYLLQYGFMESAADMNPNVKNDTPEDANLSNWKDEIVFNYVRYYQRLHNASLKTATITCNWNPNIRVGKTFFDTKNSKFGYITGVTKAITVPQGPNGAPVMVTFSLSYVRDAVQIGTPTNVLPWLKFEELPTLVDLDATNTVSFGNLL